jgi:energy-coupling factor transporter ATP-binding protein EcfA2
MITDLRLQHFRSYTDASFELDAGVNIIVGPNASGKTNLLEAVLVVARGSSYRANDAELVQFEAPWARLDADTATGARTVKLQSGPAGKWLKTFDIDGQQLQRLSAQRTLPTVLFEPNHRADKLALWPCPPALQACAGATQRASKKTAARFARAAVCVERSFKRARRSDCPRTYGADRRF